jgi:hypothetical protein
MSDIDGASLGTISVEVDRASPRQGDDTGCSLHDLVLRGVSLGMPGSTAPGDAILAPRFSGTIGPGVT